MPLARELHRAAASRRPSRRRGGGGRTSAARRSRRTAATRRSAAPGGRRARRARAGSCPCRRGSHGTSMFSASGPGSFEAAAPRDDAVGARIDRGRRHRRRDPQPRAHLGVVRALPADAARRCATRWSRCGWPVNGVPSVTTQRASSGISLAISRAYRPPRLQPIRLTGSPCRSASARMSSAQRFSTPCRGPKFAALPPRPASRSRGRAGSARSGIVVRSFAAMPGNTSTGWPSPRGRRRSHGVAATQRRVFERRPAFEQHQQRAGRARVVLGERLVGRSVDSSAGMPVSCE